MDPLHGTRTLVLQDERGVIRETHLVSAGLDYPALGPEHAWLADQGLAEFPRATDDDTLAAFETLAKLDGILPALENAHALAWVLREGRALGSATGVIVNLSGRGDKGRGGGAASACEWAARNERVAGLRAATGTEATGYGVETSPLESTPLVGAARRPGAGAR